MTALTNTRISGQLSAGRVDLYVLDCSNCGVIFAITTDYEDRRRADAKSFWCPNGHSVGWSESEADKQRKRAEQAERNLKWTEAARIAARDQAQAAHNSARAYKGHLTRMRNRIAAGVCPVQGCRRNFANVKAHVTSQHPQWAHEHAEALS
jgi:hypothetical protein